MDRDVDLVFTDCRPSLIFTGPGDGGLRSPEGSIRDERQAEEQTNGGPENSEDTEKGGESQVMT